MRGCRAARCSPGELSPSKRFCSPTQPRRRGGWSFVWLSRAFAFPLLGCGIAAAALFRACSNLPVRWLSANPRLPFPVWLHCPALSLAVLFWPSLSSQRAQDACMWRVLAAASALAAAVAAAAWLPLICPLRVAAAAFFGFLGAHIALSSAGTVFLHCHSGPEQPAGAPRGGR